MVQTSLHVRTACSVLLDLYDFQSTRNLALAGYFTHTPLEYGFMSTITYSFMSPTSGWYVIVK